jgi:glycerol-3-phosphate dehydrogenase
MSTHTDKLFDVAIVGAGVVGCAMARRFARHGHAVVLIEKGADILSGASKANSAILHTGFDAPEGSLELRCMQDGYAEYLALREALNLPLLETGAMVVAWNEDEEARLPSLLAQARNNGVADVRILSAAEVRAREPGLSPSARAALLVPREHVIDPWSPFLAYVLEARAHGAETRFRTEVTSGAFDGTHWRLETTTGPVDTRFVINAAGLFGDRLEAALLGAASFEIRPRKGQFVVFDKAAAVLLRTIVLPVPTETTKGVVVCRTAFGNVLVGPTAEEQADRERANVTRPELQALVRRAAEIVPALAEIPVTATYAGLRPATEQKNYRIHRVPDRNWITVGGIRSTGLTAALGIARHVYGLYADTEDAELPATNAVGPMPMLAEHGERDWQRPGYGEIVCHCEMVTRREIEAALDDPFPPGDFGGLKRRTRCAMGRCQGFYCGGRLAELSAGRLANDLAVGAVK